MSSQAFVRFLGMLEPGGAIRAYPALVEAQEALDDGKQQRAAELVMGHLRRHPSDPRALALLGSIALATGAFTQAERFLREAMSRGNATRDLRHQLAKCLNQQDKLEDSLAIFEQLHREAPDDNRFLGAIGWINDKLSRHDAAHAIYAQLTESHPNEPGYWIALGIALRAKGRTKDAIEAFGKARDADPTFGQSWWELASVKSYAWSDGEIDRLRHAISNTRNRGDLALLWLLNASDLGCVK